MEICKNYERKEKEYKTLIPERLEMALELANKEREDKINQKWLAEKLGTNETTIVRWKNNTNKKGVSLYWLELIASELYIDVEYLFDAEHNDPHLNSYTLQMKYQKLLDKYQPVISFLESAEYKFTFFDPSILDESTQEHTSSNHFAFIDAKNNIYMFDRKALDKFNAKMLAHAQYELLNNCTN